MDTINLEVLKQLQEYASVYFNAIVELNSTNGKCDLKPGKYTAKDMTDNSHKSVFGQYYPLPQNEEFDKEITVQSGTFHASFPYRQIFRILNEWENMCKAGKLKAVFEIGDIEIISAKVLTSEKTALGAYKTKTMKLQKVIGNWYVEAKRKIKDYSIMYYYKIDEFIFETSMGSNAMADDPEKYKVTLDNVANSFNTKLPELATNNPYFAELAKRLGIEATTPEEAQANRDAEIEHQRTEREAENKRISEECKKREQERKEAEEKRNAELLENGKKNLLNHEYVTTEQMELIAQSVGYGINIRTIGTMRKKIISMMIGERGEIGYKYYKTRNFSEKSLNGTFKVIEDLYNILKEQTKEEPIKHISEINSESWTIEEIEEKCQYKNWLWNNANEERESKYQTIADKALIEAWTNIFIASMREKKGHFISMNNFGELVEFNITPKLDIVAILNTFEEISDITAKLGCILSMIGKVYEIELMAEMIAEPPTEEVTTIIVEVKERVTEPPQTQETPPPTETPPEQRNAEISVSVPPPDITPPKQIIIVTPPKYKPSKTLINYDWNNSLAPPHNLDYEPRNASNLACIADCRACYPPDNVVHKCSQGNLCNSPPRKDHEKTKSETARQMGRDRPTSRARPSTPAERKDRETKTSENSL